MNHIPKTEKFKVLERLLDQKILFLDGAMGTSMQHYLLKEEDFRGDILLDHSIDVKGNNELLNITKPDVIKNIHYNFLKAGVDIIATNTFGATDIAQEDYATTSFVNEMNRSAV